MLVNSKRLNINVIPDIATIFSNSCSVSDRKGRSHFRMREPFRKRKWMEMENDEMADKNANEKMEQLKNKIKLLEDKIAVHEDREEGFLKDK